jgi:hypothetical protein
MAVRQWIAPVSWPRGLLMEMSAVEMIRTRLARDPAFRERLRHAFGRTLAGEGYLARLSIEQVAALYALIFQPELAAESSVTSASVLPVQ